MSSAIFEHSVALIREAIAADEVGDYTRALNLYEKGCRGMLHRLKYEKGEVTRQVLTERIDGYLVRAEQLRRASSPKPDPAILHRRVESQDATTFDLESELAKLVGNEDIKAQLRHYQKELILDRRRKDLGLALGGAYADHMLFVGNPGTGKTTVGRLVAGILLELGLLHSGHLVEVQRNDLVAGYVGQTAARTRAKIEEAKGGVLFVDEAYRLCSSSERDFGAEAINEIMSVLNDGDPVCIFAGYEEPMRAFLSMNPGLERRIPRVFKFLDFSPGEIVEILRRKARASGFYFAVEDNEDLVEAVVDGTTERQRSAMNGGLASMLFRNAKRVLDRRLSTDSPDEVLMMLRVDDVRLGTGLLPQLLEEGSNGKECVPSSDQEDALLARLNDLEGWWHVAESRRSDSASSPVAMPTVEDAPPTHPYRV